VADLAAKYLIISTLPLPFARPTDILAQPDYFPDRFQP
jgi:hypothetical protein